MNTTFQLGQLVKGEGLIFEIISIDPIIKVKCLENNGGWSKEGDFGRYYPTWIQGQEYELYLGNSEIRNFNFNGKLPWVSLYENGKACHYR